MSRKKGVDGSILVAIVRRPARGSSRLRGPFGRLNGVTRKAERKELTDIILTIVFAALARQETGLRGF